MKVTKKANDWEKKFNIRRSNAGVGFFAIARQDKLERMKKRKAEISARKVTARNDKEVSSV